MSPIADFGFYAFAIPAVFIMGLGKGGFGGSLAMVAMPIMALSGPAMQGAAIMFPILLVMDVISVWSWRKTWSRENVIIMLPGAFAGTALGFFTASYVSDASLRLMLGVMSLAFCLQAWISSGASGEPARPAWGKGTFWSTIAGFTSFISHVGGPPLSIYLLPQRMAKEVFAGTMVIYFAAMNLIKILPFAALGAFSPVNLWTSLVLAPLAAVSTVFGVWLVRRLSTAQFYRAMYGLLFVVALKLCYDGVTGLFA